MTGRHYSQSGVPYDRAGMTYDGAAYAPAILTLLPSGSDTIVDAGVASVSLLGYESEIIADGTSGICAFVGTAAEAISELSDVALNALLSGDDALADSAVAAMSVLSADADETVVDNGLVSIVLISPDEVRFDSGTATILISANGTHRVVAKHSGGGDIHVGPLTDLGPLARVETEFFIKDSGICAFTLKPGGYGFVWSEFVTAEEEEELVLLGLL